jgi:hypothetical protein
MATFLQLALWNANGLAQHALEQQPTSNSTLAQKMEDESQ